MEDGGIVNFSPLCYLKYYDPGALGGHRKTHWVFHSQSGYPIARDSGYIVLVMQSTIDNRVNLVFGTCHILKSFEAWEKYV